MTVTYLASVACIAGGGAVSAYSIAADLRRAVPVIAAAAQAPFSPAASVAPVTALQPVAIVRRRSASRVR